MDALTIAAASGMKARMESLEMLANNIANQSSAGYKADREFYNLYVSPEATASAGTGQLSWPATLPVIETQWTDFAQGTLADTGDPLHLAISGSGFFEVGGPDGLLYTRNGGFRLSPDGFIETQEGYALLDASGKPIQLSRTQEVEVTAGGELRQDGFPVARIGIAGFSNLQDLVKQSGTYFQVRDQAVKPQPVTGATLYQGKLETANLSPAESAVRLVDVMRQFEMLEKAVEIGSEMGRRAEDVARVGT
jgi:flagellar basal-body rod protein FlgF